MFFGALFGSYLYIHYTYLIFRIGSEWPPSELFRIKSNRNYLQQNAFLLVCFWYVGRNCSCMLQNQVQLSRASHLFKYVNDFQAFYFLGIQLNEIYCSAIQEWMNGIFGSLFFFYNSVFMDYMFVIGLLLSLCSSLFVLIWDKLPADIYLGFDSSYLVLATLLILFG